MRVRAVRSLAATIAWLAMLIVGPAAAQASLPEFTRLVRENSPAVVNISTTQKVDLGTQAIPELPPDHPLRDFFDRFRGEEGAPPEPFDAESLGSGFIISSDGYVLTNYHVVKNADEIVVRLSDRREFIATPVGHDESSDLALLKIKANDLPVVRMGRSSTLEVGEWVLAIGSPFGFEHSATAGIVSAKGRSLPRESYVPFIQTDVAINPGNSGGPLFNLAGEVVGINSQIYSRTGGFMGVSFAIPIELAMDVVEQLKSTGRVTRGWLGVLIQDVTRQLAESFGMNRPAGALVAQVLPNSPAEHAGMRVGDIVVEYDGQEITTSSMLPPLVGRTGIDKEVAVTVLRDGKTRTLKVRIMPLPEEDKPQPAASGKQPSQGQTIKQLGLTVDALESEQQQMLGVDSGVLVTGVIDGPAKDAGIMPGDVISLFNGRRIGSVKDFAKAVADLPKSKSVPVLVHREGSPRFLPLRVPGR